MVIAMSKQQILIRLEDDIIEWLDSQCSELGISKPQLVVSLLKEKMMSGQVISVDIKGDISASDSISSTQFEEKCSDIDNDINNLDAAISVVNNKVGINTNDINDIKVGLDDIMTKLQVIEQWIATRPKPGRPKKTV